MLGRPHCAAPARTAPLLGSLAGSFPRPAPLAASCYVAYADALCLWSGQDSDETDNARTIFRISISFPDCDRCIRPECATGAHSDAPSISSRISVFHWDYECVGQN